MRGKILSYIAKEFRILLEDKRIISVSPRGKIQFNNQTLLVGDDVEIIDNRIEKVYPRKNVLYRPKIANIDLGIIVMSLSQPNFSSYLLDKFLSLLNYCNIMPLIVLTKDDLINEIDIDKIILDYKQIGIEIIVKNKNDDSKIEYIKSLLKNKVSFVIGQTGVGKSTLINTLFPSFNLKEGEYSKALNRGKHQTKEVRLLYQDGIYIADTPGFSSLELKLYKDELKDYFPFFSLIKENCYFINCLHDKETNCKIKEAVKNNIIPLEHYQNYLKLLSELIYSHERYK